MPSECNPICPLLLRLPLTDDYLQMFSVLNEIGNNSHFRTTAVVIFSIGLSAFLYVLVAITGYLSFGNAVGGNIVAMCMPKDSPSNSFPY